MKRMLGYLLAITIFISDIPIVVNAEEDDTSVSQSVETVDETSEVDTEETETISEEAEIISELTDKRDVTTKYFAMSDGTTKACIYPQHIHYLDEGEYKEIDNTLIKDTKDGKTYYKNKKNSFSVKIPENYGDDYIKFSDENGYVKFKLKGATNKKLEKIEKEQTKKNKDKTLVDNVNDKAIFKSVKADVDIEYDVTGNKLKETIVLYKKTKNSFMFDVKTSAEKALLNNDNSVSFYDEDGEEIYTIESPYMVDSAGEYSNNIKTTLLGVDDSYTITYKPNYEWLSAKERVYPVKIDPTMFQAIYKETVADTYVTNAQTASDTRGYWDIMNIGKRTTTTGGNQIVLRGLIKFNIPSEIGSNDCIVDAKLDLVHCNYTDYVSNNGIQIDVHELTQPFSEGNAWWGNQPTYDPIITDYAIVNTGNYFSGTSLSYDSYNLTKLVNKWHNGETNHGIILKLHDDSSNVSTRQQVYYFAKQSTYYGTVSKFVEITYRNAVGLEDYWSYTTQDLGQYGTSYVNNYNGTLVYVHEDTSFDSLINGFTISHVFNSNLATHSYPVNDIMGYYGRGWRLNMVQNLDPITVTGNSSVKYVYTDGDGTRHYLVENSDGKIVDEDGLGYTYTDISEGDVTRQLTDKNNNTYKFDQWGYLRRIIDANGNIIYLNYNPIHNVDNYLSSITTSSGACYTLNYDSEYHLISITDNAQRSIQYRYNSGHLMEIEYPDGRILRFKYDTHWMIYVTTPDNTKVEYNYHFPSYRIYTVTSKGTNGTTANINTFQYLQNQTRVTDSDNRGITYQFDTWGRATCVYDDNQNIYSQTYHPTTTSGNGIFNNNKIVASSNSVGYVNNLLLNPIFSDNLTYWRTQISNPNAQYVVENNHGLTTSKSVKITNDIKTTEVIVQVPNTTSERTYTFSGYMKTENVQSEQHGASLEVVVSGMSGDKFYYSGFMTGTTDPEIDNGFQHVSATFTLDEGESIARVTAGLFNASGTVYIDSLQFEEGNVANQINLISNSGFEHNSGALTDPIGYEPNFGVSNTSGIHTTESRSGNASCKLEGAGTQTRSINQLIHVNGKSGDTYTVGCWAKAESVPNHTADVVNQANFTLHVFSYNGDVASEHILVKFNEYVSDWQYVSKTFGLTKDYTHLRIYCSYDFCCNTAYFDNLFLYRDTMHSYTYDTKGNIVSASDYANQNETFQYNNNSTLAKLISPIGSSYEYIYNNNHNMKAARSGEGLFYDVSYDSVGNVTSSKINNHNYSTSIQSGKTYYIRLKGDGKYLTVENGGTANCTNIIEESFSGGANQKWKLEKTTNEYYIFSPQNAPNMAMDVSNAENRDGANIHIYEKNNTIAQKFKIVPQTDYTYTITPECSPDGKLLTVNHAATVNNVTILTSQGMNVPDQEWYFEDAEEPNITEIEDGTVYQFRARHSGKYVDVTGIGTTVGTYLQQCEQNFGLNQRYLLQRYEETDYFTLTPAHAQNMLLEVSTELGEYGYTFLQLGDNTISERKLFKFEYNESMQGFYIIPKIDETLALDVAYYSLQNSAKLIFTSKHNETNRFFIAEKFSDTITTSATYQDNGNYPHTITDARAYTTTYTYDTNRGLQTGVTDAKGTTTTYAYNVLNDRLELVTSGNSTVSYQYETNGALKNIITPSGSIYNFFYDVFGRTTKIAIGNTTLSETTYKNNASSLVSRFDYGNGAYKTYEYDNQDRLISEGLNGTTTRTYIYDKQGNTAQTTDHLTNVTTTYTHDLIGRISRIKSSDGQTTNFIYDTYNRLSLSKWSKGDTSLSSSYIYGDNSVENQKTGLIYGVKLNGTQQLGYEYDELARLQRRLLYTTTPFATEYTYLEGASANTTTTLVKTVKNGNDTLEYTYDEIGNITNVSKNGTIIEQYTYDVLSQLISATYGGNTYTYSYDNGGNLTEIKKNGETIKTYTYANSEWRDQLTGFNGETITYDEIGNPLVYRNGINFTWQNGRQLAGITQNGSTVATYTYNADGLRNSKIVNGITTEYYWQNGTPYGQKNGDESIFYLYDENGTVYGFICKNLTEQSHYHYEFNLQGDIIGIIDSTGTRVVEYTYGAWGDLISITGTLADSIGQKNPLRYRGYYYDAETGFYYVASRYYDPEIGRFISADTEEVLGVEYQNFSQYNLYTYCWNNPVNMTDGTGTWPSWASVVVGGAVIVGLGIATAMTGGTAAIILGAAFSGSIAGGGIGAGVGLLTGGIDGALNGFATGAIVGGAIGSAAAGFNIGTGATTIVNKAHGSTLHKMATNIEAGKMAASGKYSQIALNTSLKKMGLNGGLVRPDVTGIAKRGANKIVEVVSPRQSTAYVSNKMTTMKANNPGIVGKVVTWVRNLFR